MDVGTKTIRVGTKTDCQEPGMLNNSEIRRVGSAEQVQPGPHHVVSCEVGGSQLLRPWLSSTARKTRRVSSRSQFQQRKRTCCDLQSRGAKMVYRFYLKQSSKKRKEDREYNVISWRSPAELRHLSSEPYKVAPLHSLNLQMYTAMHLRVRLIFLGTFSKLGEVTAR